MFDEEPIYQKTLVVCGTEGCAKFDVPYVVDLPTNYPTSVTCGACGNTIPTVTPWKPPAEGQDGSVKPNDGGAVLDGGVVLDGDLEVDPTPNDSEVNTVPAKPAEPTAGPPLAERKLPPPVI